MPHRGTNMALNSFSSGKSATLAERSPVTPEEFRTILFVFAGIPALIVALGVMVRMGVCQRCAEYCDRRKRRKEMRRNLEERME
ncbi:unnamed protein product [Bursaphelenchus xylophilus]|uniref:(pine wood nematode) hypothetical protein n=1 Tax=Bursaphelenchus xylophilus TaxID=6326 RepID=A0A1I7RTJ0_BURXY|nr:unnamed protein product [Bursaphelenchus xylophilus]CAG9122405.1 unnamed protein product [Bursaphelenchus xylophilus]